MPFWICGAIPSGFGSSGEEKIEEFRNINDSPHLRSCTLRLKVAIPTYSELELDCSWLIELNASGISHIAGAFR